MEYYYIEFNGKHYIMIDFVGYALPVISEYFMNYLIYVHPEANNTFTLIFRDADENLFLLEKNGTITPYNIEVFPKDGWQKLKWQKSV